MDQVLYQFRLNPTTWVYLSSFLIIVVFFKFRRFWSIRNFDLIGLMALAPGLLMVAEGRQLREQLASQPAAAPAVAAEASAPSATIEDWGFVWLMVMASIFLMRLLFDPILIRRPLLEPNLSADALTFLGILLFVFLMANVITTRLPDAPDDRPAVAGAAGDPTGDISAERLPDRPADGADPIEFETPAAAPVGDQVMGGPGFWLLDELPRIPSRAFAGGSRGQGRAAHDLAARLLLVISHLAVIVGLVFIGYRHFDNFWTGVAIGTLYLLLPYTAQMLGDVVHVVPAALLVWAVATYRRPVLSGALLGAAIGMIPPFPAFLLPLWIAFYWRRGVLRFIGGCAATVAVLTIFSLLFSPNFGAWLGQMKQMFLLPSHVEGFWAMHSPYLRIPVVAAFVALSAGLAIWPAQKNLGTLFSCSAAVMLGTQFWYPQNGLLYMNWYLPLLLLTIFRPNLEHRIAIAAVSERRRSKARMGPSAA